MNGKHTIETTFSKHMLNNVVTLNLDNVDSLRTVRFFEVVEKALRTERIGQVLEILCGRMIASVGFNPAYYPCCALNRKAKTSTRGNITIVAELQNVSDGVQVSQAWMKSTSC